MILSQHGLSNKGQPFEGKVQELFTFCLLLNYSSNKMTVVMNIHQQEPKFNPMEKKTNLQNHVGCLFKRSDCK